MGFRVFFVGRADVSRPELLELVIVVRLNDLLLAGLRGTAELGSGGLREGLLSVMGF